MIEIKKAEFTKNRFIPDSSVILSGQLGEFLEKGSIYEHNGLNFGVKIEIVLSRIVIAEVENQANQDKSKGIIGIEMLNQIREISERLNSQNNEDIQIIPYGERPSLEQIKLNSGGELDAAIRQHAIETGSTLISSDKIQTDIAMIEKIPTIYLPQTEKREITGRKIQEFFDEHSMSVHLKTDCVPYAKKGRPGHWKLMKIGDKPLSKSEILEIESNIITEAESDSDSFIEKDLKGVTVVQLKHYRIVICRPPFADSNEITAVKPLIKLTLDDYDVQPAMIDRLEKAEGILVAGSPGAGKSTFISALAEFYLEKNKVVKTLESVRDLQVPPEVTQYTDLEDDFEKTADILLLVRPDYTIYDEIRTSGDFKIFADMRLAGVGMVGVIHASSALDSIQRFIRRIELGVIPSVLDTVIFIRNGEIDEILKLEITVKVPSGFTDVGLARPVIEVSNYLNNRLLFEIYEFGSNIVVTPVRGGKMGSYGSQRISSVKNRTYERNGKKGRKGKKGKKGNTNDRYDKFGLDEEFIDDPLEDFHYFENSEDNDKDKDKDSDNDNDNYNNELDLNDGGLQPQDLIDNDEYGRSLNFDPDLIHTDSKKPQIKFGILYGKKSLVLKGGTRHSGEYIDLFENSNFIASLTLNSRGEIRVDKKTHLYHKLDGLIQTGAMIYGVIAKQ